MVGHLRTPQIDGGAGYYYCKPKINRNGLPCHELTQMKNLRKVQPQLQERIDKMICEILLNTPYYEFRKEVRGYVADVTRGQASYKDNMFTVPSWAYNPRHPKNLSSGGGYFTYYVSHELAHLIAYKKYGARCYHDFRFYKVFKEVCPKNYQYFELDYKKTASNYGICKKNSKS